MRLILAVLLTISQALPAWAACGGTDLITAMAADDRAELEARASATPYPNGLLWRAEKGQTQITMFGTYHFPHEQTDAHLQALIPQIEAADVVYLEVSNDDQAKLQTEIANDPSIMFITQGDTLIDLLGEEDWQTYKAAMEERAIPGFMAAKFKPIWAAIMLGIGPCETRAGAMEAEGIDMKVGNHAAEIENPSKSLEDYRALLTMLDSFPQEEQLDMIRLFFAWSGDADDMAYTLRQRYLAQETGIIWEYSRHVSLEFGGPDAEADFDLMEQQMLTDRNIGWVERLKERATGQKVFMAVGAAHLPGQTGVLNLLAQEGFTITRLEFDP